MKNVISKHIDLTCPYPQNYKFILAHKESECLYKFGDQANKIFLSENGCVEGTVPYTSNYDSRVYGELGPWQWICSQLRDEDEACLEHYRRKLKVLPGITLPQPLQFPCRLIDQMASYHSGKLAEAFMSVCTPTEQQIMCGNIFYPWNIYSAPVPVCKDWFGYCEDKLLKLFKTMGCGLTLEEVKMFVSDEANGFLSDGAPDKRKDVVYQCRMGGCALERLNTCYWLQQNSVPKNHSQIVFLEDGQYI